MSEDVAADALKRFFGFDGFLPGQREIVEAALAGRDALALMPTGGGKSLTYQLPATLLPGVTVVVSPLIALMKDQVDRLLANGVAATAITSALDPDERERREQAALRGAYRLLYVAPERLVNPSFLRLLDTLHSQQGIALFAVDEAHCVSEWGHDFRPEYRKIGAVRARYADTPMLGLTATATERVRADIVEQLRLREPLIHVASFNRPNLRYDVRQRGRAAYRELLVALRDLRRDNPDAPAIIYCQTRRGVESLCDKLLEDGVRAAPYHAGLAPEQRTRYQDDFIHDRTTTLVATVAFGMGVAKPDVRMVAHMDTPRNLESYYQESGRAGRDGDPAHCLLFYSPGDRARVEYFIEGMSEEQQPIARQQFQRVLSWAMESDCRRRGLLAYFGEELAEENCGACDVCLNPTEREDRTVDAQKLLSAVARTEQRFGLMYVVSVVRGENKKVIRERGHDQLSVYGIGANQSMEEWRRLGYALLAQGMLAEGANGSNAYPTVRLTPLAWEVLRGNERVEVARAREQPRVPRRGEAQLDTTAFDLFERLRALRRELADEAQVPAYVIFPDATLRALATRRPETRQQFAQIPGVGEAKIAAYAGAFLPEIRAFCDERGLESWPEVESDENAAPAPRVTEASRASGAGLGGGRGASARETLDLFRAGLSLEEIAERRNLTRTTLVGHLCDMLNAGEELDLTRLMSADRLRAIEDAFARLGASPLSPVKEALGEEVSFDDLRLVRAALRKPSP